MKRSKSDHFEFNKNEEHRFSIDKGKINGIYEVIRDDGTVIKSTFKDGMKQGPENITRDGKVIMQGSYKDGLCHGLFWSEEKIVYYVLGAIATKEEYLAYSG